MKNSEITPDLVVADVLERWPETIPVFIEHRTDCVGCAMAPFDTLSDVSQIYDLECEHFLDELRTAIRKNKERDER